LAVTAAAPAATKSGVHTAAMFEDIMSVSYEIDTTNLVECT